MTSSPAISSKLVVRTAAIGETVLAIFAFFWSWAAEISVSFQIDPSSFFSGLCFALVSFVLNIALMKLLSKNPASVISKFKQEILLPLSKNLTITDILLLAAFSGFAEELFFRGILDKHLSQYFGTTLAILVSAFLFAYVHFVGLLRLYWKLLPAYFAFGVCFSLLSLAFSSIAPAIIAHASYNALTLFYLSRSQE